jgi:hypothetical protein
MPQRASVFCNFYIRVNREALVSERALDVGSVAFKAMSTKNKFSSLVSLLSPFSSLVMQTPIFLTKLSDESIIFIIDVGKKYYPILFIIILSIPNTLQYTLS